MDTVHHGWSAAIPLLTGSRVTLGVVGTSINGCIQKCIPLGKGSARNHGQVDGVTEHVSATWYRCLPQFLIDPDLVSRRPETAPLIVGSIQGRNTAEVS